LGKLGVQKITGVHVLGDEGLGTAPTATILIFTETDYFTFIIRSSSNFLYDINSIGQNEGLFAPDSLVYAEGNLFGMSKFGPRIYTPRKTIRLGDGLLREFKSTQNLENCIARYWEEQRQVLFYIPSSQVVYYVDLKREDFPIFTYKWQSSHAITWMTELFDGGILLSSNNRIYRLGSSGKQDTFDVIPIIKTIEFGPEQFGGRPNDLLNVEECGVKFTSNTAIRIKSYINGDETDILSTGAGRPNGSLIPFGYNFSLPIRKKECKSVQIEITIDSVDAADNNLFKIHELTVNAYPIKNIKVG
jgi:hypothetical protein